MRELKLENSPLVALVDNKDYERVVGIKWYINKKTGYVYGYISNKDKPYLHRYVLQLKKDDPSLDHKDNNPLNCTRRNLRLCNDTQNVRNQRKRKVGTFTSQYKGVSWEKRVLKWRVTIFVNYKQIHVGTFDDEVEAAKAYDTKARELFGEFANTNFPEGKHAKHNR
jgi:hypothetical protein